MAKVPAFKPMAIILDPGQQAVLVGFANLHSDSSTLQDLKQDILQNAKTPQLTFGPDADISGIKALANPPEALLPTSANEASQYWSYDFGVKSTMMPVEPKKPQKSYLPSKEAAFVPMKVTLSVEQQLGIIGSLQWMSGGLPDHDYKMIVLRDLTLLFTSKGGKPQHAHSITPPEMPDGPVQLTAHQKQVIWCLSRTSPEAYTAFGPQDVPGVRSYKVSDADMETLFDIADKCDADVAPKSSLAAALTHDATPLAPLPQSSALHVAAELIEDKIAYYEEYKTDLSDDDRHMLDLCKRSRHAINAMIDVLQQSASVTKGHMSEVEAMQVVLNMAGAHYEAGNAGNTHDALQALSKVGALIGHIRHMEEDPDLKRAMAQKIVDAG